MRKKKIVIFIPSIEKGGVEKNLFIISNYLINKFKYLALITASKNSKNNFNKKIEFISPQSNKWNNFDRSFKYLISLYLLLKFILKNRNIVVFSWQANIFAILLCKLFFIKIITRSNSFPDDWANNFLKKKIFKFILPLADINIVNSQEIKNKFKRIYNSNSVCIYNPLDIKKIIILSKKNVNKIYKKKKSLKIINVGRLSEEKDHITFLKSIKFIAKKIEIEAIIMGDGKLKGKINKLIKKYLLSKYVKILNFKENPFPYMKQADFLILTSLHEGHPNVLLEAIVLKKFIISSNCETGPKEILSNGRGGALFEVKNENSLSKKILYYKKNLFLRNKKIKFSKLTLKKYNYEKNLNMYFKLLKKLIYF